MVDEIRDRLAHRIDMQLDVADEILEYLSIEDLLVLAIDKLGRVTPTAGLSIVEEHTREALYQLRLWVIGQGVL